MAHTARTTTIPYTMTLPDGSTLFLRIPKRMAGRDRDGSLTIKPEGVELLDRVRVLAMKTPARPIPGYLKTLRKVLNLTPSSFARTLGYSAISVKKWEAGTAMPGARAIRKIQRLVDEAGKRGVILT